MEPTNTFTKNRDDAFPTQRPQNGWELLDGHVDDRVRHREEYLATVLLAQI